MRVALVDDEPLARQVMRRLLSAHADVTIVGEAGTISRAREMIRESRPDVLFLDIQMHGATGFDLVERLDALPHIVFITAHAQHAVQAFEVKAVDYLLKPVRPERLARTIERLAALQGAGAPDQSALSGRICFRAPERSVVAPLDRIAALQADGDFVRVSVAGESPLLVCQTLSSYSASLPHPPFASIGRSLLINLGRVQRLEHIDRNRTLLWLEGMPEPLELGRAASRRLRAILSNRDGPSPNGADRHTAA